MNEPIRVTLALLAAMLIVLFGGCRSTSGQDLAPGKAEQTEPLAGVSSNEWVSPIDKKYSAQSPELFSEFDKARDLLDSWSGQNERLMAANSILVKILERDANFAPAYRELGRMFIMAGVINSGNYREGSLEYAETAILKSLEIEPDYADSYVLLGHLYTNMKKYNEAREALIKAVKIGSESPWLQLNWAELSKREKDYDDAMERYQYVVSLGASNRKVYLSALGGVTTIYRYKKEYDKANEGYKMQIAFDSDNAWLWGNYSDFLLFTYQDVDGAIEKAEKAIGLRNYGMGRFTLACALYTKWAQLLQLPNMEEQAQSFFERAWEIYPYPEKVIERTKKYKYTRITSAALENWLATEKAL